MKKATNATEPANHIAVFQESSIRRVWRNEEWWFALSDVVAVLTDSADVKQYIKKMRSRDPALDANWGTTCTRRPRTARIRMLASKTRALLLMPPQTPVSWACLRVYGWF